MYIVFFLPPPEINVVTLVTRESSGLFTVQSELQVRVVKEDKDASFSCEVSYYVPGAARTAESKGINITVHCKDPHLVTSSLTQAKAYPEQRR